MGELRVRLLGGLVVEGLRPAEVGSRKARTLLAVLAVRHGRSVPIDVLAEAVWGDDPPARPHDQLGVLVSRLRGALGAAHLERADAGYRLRADWVDAEELDARATTARDRLRAGDGTTARLAASIGLDLVAGPLLPEDDGPWLDAPRARVGRTIAELHMIAAEGALSAGDAIGAAAAAGAGLDHDPFDEAALRALMTAHVALGRPASALAAYAELRARLVEELGVDPAPETEALHTAILRGEAIPGTSVGAPVPVAPGPAERSDPLVQRARLELAATDLDAARRDADEAVRRGGGAGAIELAGWVAYYQRDFEAALRWAETGGLEAVEPDRRRSCLTLAGRVRHSRGDLALAERDLQEAAAAHASGVRAVAEVWLGGVRAHQGRPLESLELAERGAVDDAAMRHPFVIPHSLVNRTYALGQLGRVHEALDTLAVWDQTLDDLGDAGDRYRAVAHNFWGWVLAAVGRREEAEAHHLAAVESAGAFTEPLTHAFLDLAKVRLEAGDGSGAAGWLEKVDLAGHGEGTMLWHQWQRLWLLQARLALLDGRPADAHELAIRLVDDATGRGSLRARLQGEVVVHLAATQAGQPPAPERISATLTGLDAVDGLGAWRAAAELAAATRVSGLWAEAERRAERLVSSSGPHGPGVRDWVRGELDRLGSGR